MTSFVKTQSHVNHAFVKHLQLGFNASFNHSITKILNGVFSIHKYFITTKVECTTVQCCHFGVQLYWLQALIVGHTHSTTRRGLYNHIGASSLNGCHHLFKSIFVLCGCAIVVAHMQVYYTSTSIVSRFCLSHTLFYSVRNCRIVFFQYFCSRNSSRYY